MRRHDQDPKSYLSCMRCVTRIEFDRQRLRSLPQSQADCHIPKRRALTCRRAPGVLYAIDNLLLSLIHTLRATLLTRLNGSQSKQNPAPSLPPRDRPTHIPNEVTKTRTLRSNHSTSPPSTPFITSRDVESSVPASASKRRSQPPVSSPMVTHRQGFSLRSQCQQPGRHISIMVCGGAFGPPRLVDAHLTTAVSDMRLQRRGLFVGYIVPVGRVWVSSGW